jgi:hypothetical protein
MVINSAPRGDGRAIDTGSFSRTLERAGKWLESLISFADHWPDNLPNRETRENLVDVGQLSEWKEQAQDFAVGVESDLDRTAAQELLDLLDNLSTLAGYVMEACIEYSRSFRGELAKFLVDEGELSFACTTRLGELALLQHEATCVFLELSSCRSALTTGPSTA